MASYYSGNFYLSLDQMKTNATCIYDLLSSAGWSLEAICGLLGNTETESTHNPGIWQNLAVNVGPGYGLTQWTPASKYRVWCSKQGLEPARMESAIARLKYEVVHPSEQWVQHSAYNMSFSEFTQSTESPAYLAMVFLHNYEMPNDLNQPQRGTQASYWYEYLTGGEPAPPGPPGPPPGVSYNKNRNFLVPILKKGWNRNG